MTLVDLTLEPSSLVLASQKYFLFPSFIRNALSSSVTLPPCLFAALVFIIEFFQKILCSLLPEVEQCNLTVPFTNPSAV